MRRSIVRHGSWLVLLACNALFGACSSPPATSDAGGNDAASDAVIDSPSIVDQSAEPAPDVATDASTIDAGCPALPTVDPEQITKGNPSWQLAELAVYVAPIGDMSDGSAATQSFDAVFTPKHVFDTNLNMLKSAIAHDPPYDGEVAAGLTQAGFTNTGCIALSDLNAPSGIIVSMNLVPSASAPVGTSFEQPDGGPVIAFDALNSAADLYIDGVLVDPYFDSSFPKADFVYGYPDVSLAGFGHLLLNFGENQAFAPTTLTAGQWELVIKLDDGGANSTLDAIHFTVH
jgi:hypothetical protein